MNTRNPDLTNVKVESDFSDRSLCPLLTQSRHDHQNKPKKGAQNARPFHSSTIAQLLRFQLFLGELMLRDDPPVWDWSNLAA